MTEKREKTGMKVTKTWIEEISHKIRFYAQKASSPWWTLVCTSQILQRQGAFAAAGGTWSRWVGWGKQPGVEIRHSRANLNEMWGGLTQYLSKPGGRNKEEKGRQEKSRNIGAIAHGEVLALLNSHLLKLLNSHPESHDGQNKRVSPRSCQDCEATKEK